MKRGILIGGGVVVVLIAVVAYYLYSSLDTLIQAAVEKYGSEITQAEVTLDGVELDPVSGKGALRGLTVGNPEGFETPSAFEVGAISIEVDISTIASDTIVIKKIVIDKPGVTYELSGDGNNIDAIRNNIDAYMAKHGLAKGGGEAGKEQDEGPKLIIENLYVRDGTVSVSATILKGKSMTAPLPDIHLKDIGKEEGGASPGEVVERVMTSLGDGASKAVGGLGVGKTLDSLKQSLSGVTEGVGKSVGEATKSIGEDIGSGAKKAGEKLKGLFQQ